MESNYPIWPFSLYKQNKFKRFHTYAEYYEDLILYIILYDIKKGFYIDIGAYDPIKVSVTKAFYLRGWHGINIEPQLEQIKLFYKDRPKDINLQMGIGKEKGNTTFYLDDQCSSFIKKYANNSENITSIKIDNMSNICKKYVPKGTEIDFCKIDVEGGEKDVLLGYDFINYRPKVFCIESTIPRSMIPNHKEWEKIIIDNNYTYVYERGVNRYYIDNNYSNLIERAKYIHKYLKNIINKNKKFYKRLKKY